MTSEHAFSITALENVKERFYPPIAVPKKKPEAKRMLYSKKDNGSEYNGTDPHQQSPSTLSKSNTIYNINLPFKYSHMDKGENRMPSRESNVSSRFVKGLSSDH
mmetsp:Transcript_6143/g.5540  ORF Transcript_6143/g.5540 Transcript_6143/m.5540 type:complete len:104 (+) Transcript_6143:888-1199(+)|eukprot:CAMPEP_0170568132 /NCGR_PEP_ID=MMETSP0211-20121228/80955_1 /TAXON_ID=311385 /ORGANISM="Pseudokeronopsis sp., Strain OXSARD2" /LENGTH=103 /DNA_ID=CAMNT_0010889841 /DNA_START=940 /DNA_END=1251 /DNA_ORIENTATION=-